MIAGIEAAAARDEFEVWPENMEALECFLTVSTQWRAIPRPDGSVYWQGLDYAGVSAGIAGAGLTAPPSIWADLRIMEAAARDELNGIGASAQ